MIGVLVVVGFLLVPDATIQVLVAAGIALLIAIAIAELIDQLWEGSPAADVTEVTVEEATLAAPASFTTG